MDAKIRLYVDHALALGQAVPLTEGQAHYLFGVMRLTVGGAVLLFNGRDGEWRAEVAVAGKRGGVLVCAGLVRPVQMPPDVWLLFAPLKKARTDFVVEKAVELGVARILPVQTRFTNGERVRRDKLAAHAIEAAEQCGATYVPEVAEVVALDKLLAEWPLGRRILWCDESLAGASCALAGDVGGAWAILVGPEGGFAEAEKALLRGMAGVVSLSLGPRVLRAETAVVAALTLWQSALGDWR